MKALVTLSFVFDLPEEDLAGLGSRFEEAAMTELLSVVEGLGLDADDLSEVSKIMEFYGCAVTVQRDLVA